MDKYELWLDESGDFRPENEKDPNKHPSLVGGVLVPDGSITDKEITQLLGQDDPEGFAHAMNFGKTEMAGRVLPALEALHRHGAKLVYFENAERLDVYSSRELYLRMLAGGLVQLMQRLAVEGEFVLDVMIAVRYIEVERDILNQIKDNEYINTLRSYIRDSWEEEHLSISENCRLNITILSARQERRLQLADFACNARLTSRSGKFDGEMRLRLNDLFEDDFIYSVRINTSENRIYAHLADNNASAALTEFYTGHGNMDRGKMLDLILQKLGSLPHIEGSRQLEDFSLRISSLMNSWYDLEQNEAILKDIKGHLFQEIASRELDVQTDEAQFRILDCLCNMYIMEGDLLHAKPELEEMRQLIRTMSYRIENLEHLYHYNDRKALYEAACLDFDASLQTTQITIRVLRNIIGILEADDRLLAYLGDKHEMRSEILAKALTMKLHALLYIQRADKSVNNEIRQTAEEIRRHCNFEGELRRMLQYMAKAEMENGCPEKALENLLASDHVSLQDMSAEEACILYLDVSEEMDPDSRAYNMMYYVQIMEAAVKNGAPELAQEMQRALERQKGMRDELLTEKVLRTNLKSDVKKSPVIHEDMLQRSLSFKRRKYHPLEMICWKYGAYLAQSGAADGKAQEYFEKAILICGSNPDYSMLHMIGLAVRLERFYWALTTRPLAECKSGWNSLTGTIRKRRQRDLDQWPEKMQSLVRRMEKVLRRFPSLTEEEAAGYAKEIYELSQAVPF